MAFASGSQDSSPMMDMNTTPLIDVMLVLLIMFIITIPIATHSVDVDLPVGDPPIDVTLGDVKNKIIVTAQDQILWNGTAVDEPQIASLLLASRQLTVEPELQFEPEAAASYAASASVLRTIKASGVTKFGFVGNEKYRSFGKST